MIKAGWRTRPGKHGDGYDGAHGLEDEIESLSVEFGDDIELESNLIGDLDDPSKKHPKIYIRVGETEIRISARSVEVSSADYITVSAPIRFHGV
jgi:hypothetical protein